MPTANSKPPVTTQWDKRLLERMAIRAGMMAIQPAKYRKLTRQIARFAQQRIIEDIEPETMTARRNKMLRFQDAAFYWHTKDLCVLLQYLAGVIEQRDTTTSVAKSCAEEISRLSGIISSCVE